METALWIIGLLAALAGMVIALLRRKQPGPPEKVEPKPDPPKPILEWTDYNPTGSKKDVNIFEDVLSHCTPEGRKIAYDADKVTYCHEVTHQVNSHIRNKFQKQGFYCGNGRCFLLSRPGSNVKLEHVCEFVEDQYKNSTYDLYLVKQRKWWNDDPLYVLDEQAAYINGSQTAKELNVDEHGSFDRCIWFGHYAQAMIQAVKKYDPHYSDLKKLEAFVDYQSNRARVITQS